MPAIAMIFSPASPSRPGSPDGRFLSALSGQAGTKTLVRSVVALLGVLGLAACAALPGLPQDPSHQAAAHGLVGAAASLCTDALDWLKAEPVREVRLDYLAGASVTASAGSQAGRAGALRLAENAASGTELVLRDVRDLRLPHLSPGRVTPLTADGSEYLHDSRSRLADQSSIVEATVLAADLAYDIRERAQPDLPQAEPAEAADVARELPHYVVHKIYVDDFSGLKGFALESRDGTHRIYAVAGTQVFASRDYRDWASGLAMARPQFTSDAGLLMARDAAEYASAPDRGGEVIFTGQSQGALVVQGLGFLTEELLDERPDPHRLVHIVAWGMAGATEQIVDVIQRSRQGYERDIWPPLERHWSLTDPEHRAAMQVWGTLESRWAGFGETEIAAHVASVAREMHVIGYFFDIDPFARAGSFLGTPLVFPVELVLPRRCEPLITELVFDAPTGEIGLRLESHFLNGYRRAVRRGAVDLARPVQLEERGWILDLLSTAEPMARAWLRNIYLGGLGGDPANWRRCFASGHWMTDANRDCRRSYWPGCAPGGELRPDQAADGPGWCLLTDDGRDDAGQPFPTSLGGGNGIPAAALASQLYPVPSQ